jgi:hypothetical protein
MPEVDVSIRISNERALDFAKRLARDDEFRERVATEPVPVLEEYGITLSNAEQIDFAPILPPKHAVEEALVNVREASEFASSAGFESADPFAFWIFMVFVGT